MANRRTTHKTATRRRVREISALWGIATLFLYFGALVYYKKHYSVASFSRYDVALLVSLPIIGMVAFQTYFFRFLHFIHEDRKMIVRIRARQFREEKRRRAKKIALIAKLHAQYVIGEITPTSTPGVFDVTFENKISDIAPPEIYANGRRILYVRKFDQMDFYTIRCDLFKNNVIDVTIDTIHFTCGHRPPVHVLNVYKSRFEHKDTNWKWNEHGELIKLSISNPMKQFPHITEKIALPFQILSNDNVIAEVHGRLNPQSDTIVFSLEDVPTKNLISHNNSIRYAFENVSV